MTTKRTKRPYTKPAMQVYVLPELMKLLVESGGFGGNPGYEPLP